MTAQSRAFETAGPLVRWQAVASIIRKDMHLFGWYAAACAAAVFVVSALFHEQGDFPVMLLRSGRGQLHLDAALLTLCAVGLPAALILFVILLAQTNVAFDTRHDWLIRPVTPLELVAAKLATIVCVIVAPMIAGSFIYMMVKGVPLEEAFVFFMPALTSGLVLVLSWLVSTPFRAVLAFLGMFVLLAVAIMLPEVIKIAIGYAATGGRFDPTPFPNLDNSWIVGRVADIGLFVVSGVTLWLLLARRKRTTARWLFVGYFAGSVFLQNLLFSPI